MTATVHAHPSAPQVTRTTILTLRRGPALRFHVVEERAVGCALLYWVITENVWVSGTQTIVGPISGQHHAIAIARASAA